jgi:class 3 adenylate cyclase
MKNVAAVFAAAVALACGNGFASYFGMSEGEILKLDDEIAYRADDGAPFERIASSNEGWIAQKEKPFVPDGKPVRLWARFDLPPATAQRELLIDNYNWEKVEYFLVREGKLVDRQRAGILEPWSARKVRITLDQPAFHAGFASVIQDPGVNITVFARLQSDNRFVAVRGLRFYGWDGAVVRAGEQRDLLVWCFLLGMMGLLVIYNLAVFAMMREASYPYYAMHLVGGMIAMGASLLFAYAWPERPSWNFYVVWIGAALAVAGHFQFARHFLDTRRNFRAIDRALNALTVVFVGLVAAAVVDLSITENPLFGIAGFIPSYGIFALAIYAVARRHPLGWYFFAGTASLTAGVTIASLPGFGVMEPSHLAEIAGMIGAVAEGILLSMGLGYRLQRQQAAHEGEKRALVEEQNRTLEARVEQRTAELTASQQQSEALLANILPAAVIEELKKDGVSEPRRHEEVSILFTDFAGFTQTVATIPPKRLVQELDEIFRAFDDIIARNGLEKIKTIGDSYMAASGAPTAAGDHAVRCVRAGLALARFIEERNARSAMKWGLRVGVHSGAVVAGIVGKVKYAYDVWGDTVNIASRLESASEIGRLNVSAYTCELVRDGFDCEYRGKLAAKGKGEIDMYFVMRERVAAAAAPAHA